MPVEKLPHTDSRFKNKSRQFLIQHSSGNVQD
jgi:hypothetical protein